MVRMLYCATTAIYASTSVHFLNRFREAAAAINELPVEKLPLLLNRIIEKLHLRVSRQ
jgi:hypothetical protein